MEIKRDRYELDIRIHASIQNKTILSSNQHCREVECYICDTS